MVTIRFARLELTPKLSHFTSDQEALERRRETLRNVIRYETEINLLLEGSEQEYLINRGDWNFAGIDVGEDYISGKIGKETDNERTVRDDEKKDYVEKEGQDADIAFFVIDLRNSVMAYEYRRNVGKKVPYRLIQGIYNSYHEGKEELKASALIDREEFRQAVSEIEEIKKVSFTNLSPTNPDFTEYSKAMDEFLREINVDNANINATGDDIDLFGKDEIAGAVGLSEEGHGTATVVGTDGRGNEREVSTEHKAAKTETEESESDPRHREKLINEIKDQLDKLED